MKLNTLNQNNNLAIFNELRILFRFLSVYLFRSEVLP